MLEWLKARWRWVVVASAVALAFLWGFFSRKPKVVSPSIEAQGARLKVEEEAELRKARLRKELELQLAAIRTERDAAVQELTDEQVEAYAELREDPQKLNSWLLSVGRQVRQ